MPGNTGCVARARLSRTAVFILFLRLASLESTAIRPTIDPGLAGLNVWPDHDQLPVKLQPTPARIALTNAAESDHDRDVGGCNRVGFRS